MVERRSWVRSLLASTALVGLGLAVAGAPAGAASLTWLGGDSTFTSAANWNPNQAPTNADDLTISGAGTQPIVTAAIDVQNITLTAGSLTLSIAAPPTNVNVVNTFAMSGGTLTATTANTLAAGTFNQTAGLISGQVFLSILAGGGTLTGNNTYTGGTSIANGGTLTLQSVNSAGTGAIFVFSGSTLTLGATGTLANQLSFGSNGFPGPSTIGAAAGQTVTLTGQVVANGFPVAIGSSTMTGTLVVTSGAAPTGTIPQLTVAGGTVRDGNGTLATILGTATTGVTIGTSATAATYDMNGFAATLNNLSGTASGVITDGGAAATLTLNNTAASTFAGVIQNGAGAISVVKTGAATLTLSGANTYSGGTALNAGTIAVGNNTALGTAALAMANGTTLQAAAGGLTLANAITLAGTDTIDTNGGAFTLNGVISGTGGFTKISAGTLTLGGVNTYTGPTVVSAGSLVISGTGRLAGLAGVHSNVTVQNGASMTVAAGGQADVNTLTVDAGGTVTNAGTINGFGASINVAGVLNTAGVLTDATDINVLAGGVLNAAGTVTAPLVTNAGTINVVGALGGPITTLNNTGTINLGGNTFGGITTLANNGTIVGGGALTGAAVAGTGTINLLASSTASLTVGSITGNQTVLVTLDPIAATAGRIIATAPGTGTGTLTFNITQNTLRPTSAPVTIAQGVTNTAVRAFGTVVFGFVNTALINPAPGLWQITTTVSPNAGAPGSSIAAVVTSLATGFFSSTNAFVTSPTSETPNKLHGGPWIRIQAGQYDISGTNSVNFGTLTANAVNKVRTMFSGFQVGTDIGLLNVGGTGANIHAGLMAGSVDANADQRGSANPTTGKFSVPFVGAYTALIYGNFSADLQYRHDYYTIDLTNNAGFNGTLLGQKAEGDSVNGSVAYRFNLPYDFFLEPSLGFNYTRVSMNPLLAGNPGQLGVQGGTISFSAVESKLGRAGFRVGTNFLLNDKFILQPFVTAAVWKEFSGDSRSAFTFTGSNDIVSISSTRVGTFGQVGLGLTTQVIGTNLVGYVRGDVRFGDNIRGGSVNAGIRYDF